MSSESLEERPLGHSPIVKYVRRLFVGEFCAFRGGQRIKYSDGSVLVLGGFVFSYSVTGDTDINEHSITALFPPTTSTSFQLLSGFVARGSGYRGLYLTWNRDPEELKLVYDSNNNLTADASDTVIATLSLTDW